MEKLQEITFIALLEKLNKEQVAIWWESVTPDNVPKEAKKTNWKYFLEKDNKRIEFKWALYDLAKHYGYTFTTFNSDKGSRNAICERFDFDIYEKLVYDNSEKKAFLKLYNNKIQLKPVFQDFINYAGDILTKNNFNAYKTRMAIDTKNDALFIIGMRTVVSYREKDSKAIIGFVVSDDFANKTSLEKRYQYKGEPQQSYLEYTVSNWQELPENLLSENTIEIQKQYNSVKDTKRSTWNSEANTTNSVLKYLMFKKLNVEDWLLENITIEKDYFNLNAIKEYQKLAKTEYITNSKAYQIFNDTRGKIDYLVSLLSEGLGMDLSLNYNEKPNKQAGQGKGFVFKDYIIRGFIPSKYKNNKEIFIKCSFYFWDDIPKFHFQIDLNFKNKDNPYKKDREKLLNSKPFTLDINDSFPKSWQELLKISIPKVHNLIIELENYLNPLAKKNIQLENKNMIKHPLNQILYGPPGTGKTYETKELAVKIIDGEVPETRVELSNRYKELIESKQILFTTFHQSMSYEDFVEGIKPKTIDNKDVVYNVEDGIFKCICEKAQKKNELINFDDVYNNFIQDVVEMGKLTLETPSQNKPFDVIINSNKTPVAIPHTEIRTEMSITENYIKEYIINGKTLDWASYTKPIGDYIIDKYNIHSKSIDNSLKSYVLIIDEINRGNVSAIFGELITLIEEDKRLGNDEALTITLPYSKKPFGVPKNLYIIGTMNTADRSVEALDTALRRRFNFTEMMPKYYLKELDTDLDVNLKLTLDKINKRIEILLDREHQIGHSYFLNIKTEADLLNAFQNKIIPLLQEYFYNDYDKIGLVLGDKFIEKNKHRDSAIFSSYALSNKVDYLQDTFSWKKLDTSNIIKAVKSIIETENND